VHTVESLEKDGELDPVQQGFVQCHGLQCGFCTPGMMMTARALLNRDPDPSEATIREAISGQICRCTGYTTIVRSVQWAAAHEAAARAGAIDDAAAAATATVEARDSEEVGATS
jgi:carbon-monoxide dehydrogenase small subunit